MYDIIFTQRKSIKNFNRSLTILGGEEAPDPPKGDKPEKDGRRCELRGQWWERWEGVGAVGVNYVLLLGGGVFDFFAGLIHSLSDAALL